MTSPLVARLVANVNSCTDQEQRAVYVAELACYLARVGEFDEAERLRGDLRREFGDARSAPVSILIMCLESLLLYFKELNPQARDRMLRANLLSRSFQQDRLTALTSAWMAHIDFNQNRFAAMADSLMACANALHADDGSAECRMSIVLGDAFLFAGDAAASRAWYENARRIATVAGDHAGIGAMTYNRAALRVSTARFRNLTQPIAQEEASLINSEVNSAINYQAAARLKSLEHLLSTARAGVLMLRGIYDQAKVQIEQLLLSGSLANNSTEQRLLQADLVYINARAGRSREAETWVNGAADAALDMTADDRALMLSTASAVASLLGDKTLQSDLSLAAHQAIEEHKATMHGLLQSIARYRHGKFRSDEQGSEL